jgi:phospholipid/cholesterol/gamma-HCH transport system permease protein
MSSVVQCLEGIGAGLRHKLAEIGRATGLFVRLLSLLPAALRRLRLVIDQVHLLGNHSLAIIVVSGLNAVSSRGAR